MNITCENIRQHYEGKLSLSPPLSLTKSMRDKQAFSDNEKTRKWQKCN